MDRNHTNYALLDLDLSLHRCAQNNITSDEILQLLKACNLSIVTNMMSELESKAKEREVYLLKILQAVIGMLEVDAMVLDGQGFNVDTEKSAIEWTRKEIERLQK